MSSPALKRSDRATALPSELAVDSGPWLTVHPIDGLWWPSLYTKASLGARVAWIPLLSTSPPHPEPKHLHLVNLPSRICPHASQHSQRNLHLPNYRSCRIPHYTVSFLLSPCWPLKLCQCLGSLAYSGHWQLHSKTIKICGKQTFPLISFLFQTSPTGITQLQQTQLKPTQTLSPKIFFMILEINKHGNHIYKWFWGAAWCWKLLKDTCSHV